MHSPDDSLRAALAEQAARQILHGYSPATLYPRLRRQTSAELLSEAQQFSGTHRVLALRAALDALLCAAQFAVRRRSGWLKTRGIQDIPVSFSIGVHDTLLQAALLCFMRDCLLGGAAACITCRTVRGAVLLQLRSNHGGCSKETSSLLSALAHTSGGAALFNTESGFTAVMRLPVAATPCVVVDFPTADDLLRDRFCPLYLYLHGLCADPWQ